MDILDSGHVIPKEYKVFIYNGLGVSNTLLGRYQDALKYYNLVEKYVFSKTDSSYYLGDIYGNKAIIYGYQKSYQVAIDYFEKGIRIHLP
jgi:tetratricopeptide (TPR) repeat protein